MEKAPAIWRRKYSNKRYNQKDRQAAAEPPQANIKQTLIVSSCVVNHHLNYPFRVVRITSSSLCVPVVGSIGLFFHLFVCALQFNSLQFNSRQWNESIRAAGSTFFRDSCCHYLSDTASPSAGPIGSFLITALAFQSVPIVSAFGRDTFLSFPS